MRSSDQKTVWQQHEAEHHRCQTEFNGERPDRAGADRKAIVTQIATLYNRGEQKSISNTEVDGLQLEDWEKRGLG